MSRISPLPSLLTLGNFACGFIAMNLCLQTVEWKGDPHRSAMYLGWACAVVFFAIFFDMLDGRVARMTGSSSRFGAELDSLADVVSFGLAPPMVLATLWVRAQPETARWWSVVMVCGLVYGSCAVLRLARYNVRPASADKNIFLGLPSPAAAGALVSAVLLARQPYMQRIWQIFWNEVAPRIADFGVDPGGLAGFQAKVLAFYGLLLGALMVSDLRFLHVANRYLGGRKRFSFLAAIVFVLALMLLRPVEVIAIGLNGYILAGLVFNGRDGWRRWRQQAADRKLRRQAMAGDAP